MRKLVIFTLVGFFAQLIDGTLGMGYGLSSATLLLTFSVAPAIASATIHLAEITTTAASGFFHWKFGNVEKRVVGWLTIPGAVGAFCGATFLSQVPGTLIKPYISLFLFSLGLYIIFRFLAKPKHKKPSAPLSKARSILLGLFAGFADSSGGGGWGAIATPVLLATNHDPRRAVGTAAASEFMIAVAASIGFLISLDWKQLNGYWILLFMSSGIVAAPLAAFLVKKLPVTILGSLTGGLIIILNAYTLLQS